MRKGRRLALHPFFLVSLAILLINDHILKDMYPGFLTGKLSDFAGLFMFPVFLYIIFEKFIRNGKRLIFLHILIALGFIIWKLAPMELLLARINELTSLPMPGRVKDSTDLIALSMLPLSYMFIMIRGLSVLSVLSRFRIAASRASIIAAAIAVMATSYMKTYKIEPHFIIESNEKEISKQLFLFEQSLIEQGFDIKDRIIKNDTSFVYCTSIDRYFERSYKPKDSAEIQISRFWSEIGCEITIRRGKIGKNLLIGLVELKIRNGMLEEHDISDILWNKIIKPYERKLREYEKSG